MSTQPHLRIVGYGNMGQALVRGWLAAGTAPTAIRVVDSHPEAVRRAASQGLVVTDASDRACDVLILAVKPHQITDVLAEQRSAMSAGAVVLSIAAGRRIDSLTAGLGAGQAAVRAMPNTPSAIAQGTTVLCASESATPEHKSVCTQLLEAVGSVHWIDDESLFDAVTAVSGSGPAYVFLLAECLAAAGERLGLTAELAMSLALETIAGAGAYAAGSSTDVATLREQVTSPAGTTAAALEVFMRDDALGRLVDAALDAAAKRSSELAQ